MKRIIYSGFLLSVLLFVSFLPRTAAQFTLTDQPADSVTGSFFPILGFSSDIGLIAGGAYSHFDYRGPTRPFKSRWQALGAVSTKGLIKVDLLYERTGTFGSNVRSKFELEIERLNEDNFFGIGNSTRFDKELWENEFYYFKSLNIEFEYRGRVPLYKKRQTSLDWTFGLRTQFQESYLVTDNSLFNTEPPPGSEGGWVNSLKTGLLWENRDSEFNPTGGNRAEITLQYAPNLLSNDFEMASFSIDVRQYARLINFVTVAGRVRARVTSGDVPYWELSALGEENTLRGYPRNRFMGTSSIEYNLELRKWLFYFPRSRIKLGGQLFTDIGRVFTGADAFGDLFEDYKQTFGFGGAISLFNPDFILRGDVGFSEDLTQVYISAGYMF